MFSGDVKQLQKEGFHWGDEKRQQAFSYKQNPGLAC